MATFSARAGAALVLGVLLSMPVSGQNAPPPAADTDSVAEPADDLNRETPRRTMRGFMRAFERGDYDTAAEYLDIAGLPPPYRDAGPAELARQLGVVISREVWINPTDLSDEAAGVTDDRLPAAQDRLAMLRGASGDIELLLQRVERADGALIWKISNTTVARTADLYPEFGYGPIVELFAGKLPQVSILGVELFKWILALAAGLLTWSILSLASWLFTRTRSGPRSESKERLFRYFRGPVALVIASLVSIVVLYELGLGVTGRRIAAGHTVPILLCTWLVLSTLNLVRDYRIASLARQGREGAIVLQRPMVAAIKLVVVAIAVVTWLDNVGYNVTTLLASLGVGGIAVALALQRPMEDVFGAFTLYNQQPVRIGDFCRFGDTVGVVEEIGLRTTRIRTRANTLLSVPNAKIAGETLENFSARRKILFHPTLRLRSDTAPDVLRRVLDGIHGMLASHERVIQEQPRVRFARIGTDALELDVFAYLDTTEWPEYLQLAEDLNFKILDVIAAAGASLALPARTLFVEQQPP